MTTAMKRWTCPLCTAGKLAPGRPRRDDTRRYCLPCSEKTGRLVERVCAALEGARAAREEAAKAKAAKAAVSRKATRSTKAADERARLTIGGAYLSDFVRPYWRLLCEEARKVSPGLIVPAHDVPPALVVARSTRAGYYRGTGSRRRTHLRFGPSGIDKATALELLLHELCHGACAAANRAEGAHGPTFRRTLRAAAKRLWGVEVIIPQHRYALDDLIVVELRKLWNLPAGATHWLDHARAGRERRAAKHSAPAVSPAETPAQSAGTEVQP